MLARESLFAGLTLVLVVATSAGCASGGASNSPSSSPSGKVRMKSSTMCSAHGGEYNAITKKCQYMASTRSAQQTCEAHHGYYDTAADVCEIGAD
jgi:hypothetical protein